MRPGQGNRRNNRRNGHGGGHGGGHSGGSGHSSGGSHSSHHSRPRNATSLRNQIFDSNGPDTRVRGNAFQVHEKYLGLAKDALSSGDRVLAENYLQHAEHYYRIIEAINEATAAEQRTRQTTYMDSAEQPQPNASGFYNSVGEMGDGSTPPQNQVGNQQAPMADGERQGGMGGEEENDESADALQQDQVAAGGRR